MSESSFSISIGISGPVLFGAIAYFVYGGLDAAIGIFLLTVVTSMFVWLGFIPVLGAIVYYFLMKDFIHPYILDFAGLEPTLLTTVILWLYVLLTVFVTLVSPLIWYSFLREDRVVYG